MGKRKGKVAAGGGRGGAGAFSPEGGGGGGEAGEEGKEEGRQGDFPTWLPLVGGELGKRAVRLTKGAEHTRVSDDAPSVTSHAQVHRHARSRALARRERCHLWQPRLVGGYKYLNIYKSSPAQSLAKNSPVANVVL